MQRDININPTQMIITFILFVGILPALNIAGFTVPWQYLFTPVFIFILMLIGFGYIKVPTIGKYLIEIWLLIIFEVVFSAVFGPMIKFNSFSFPNEALQYIVRFLIFIFFIALFFSKSINLNTFMNRFLVILLLGMGVGFIQFFDLPGSSFFRLIYAYSERYLEFMTRDNLSSRRVTGFAQHATSNGGITAFTLTVILSMYFFYKKRLFITSIGVLLVIINIVGSQARMGYVTIAISAVILYLIYNYVYEKGVKPTIKMGALVTFVVGVIYWLYIRGNDFVVKAVYRWEVLGDNIAAGRDRVGQIIEGFKLLQTPFDYLFGVSKEVERIMGGTFLEVEPVNIFILYGLVGFLLQYGLILFLLVYLFKNIEKVKQYPILLTMVIASFIGLLGYQVFSFAYYFFREIHIGLIPWILLGATIGAVERFKKYPEQFDSYKRNEKETKTKVRKRKRYRITW